MAVQIEIRDGDPWYLSPDVWTVPGDDPEGAPGMPVEGASCFLWAKVRNNGSTRAEGVTINYYWADPSAGFNRSTANFVGTSYTALDPGETRDVLCLTPWFPAFINDGHACILAEAFVPNVDPLPDSIEFNVPTDRHVAQRNLSIVQASTARGFFGFSFMLINNSRLEQSFEVNLRQGKAGELKALATHLPDLPTKLGKAKGIVFTAEKSCFSEGADLPKEKNKKQVRLKGNQKIAVHIAGQVDKSPALIHVDQVLNDRVVGGLSVLVNHTNSKQTKS